MLEEEQQKEALGRLLRPIPASVPPEELDSFITNYEGRKLPVPLSGYNLLVTENPALAKFLCVATGSAAHYFAALALNVRAVQCCHNAAWM